MIVKIKTAIKKINPRSPRFMIGIILLIIISLALLTLSIVSENQRQTQDGSGWQSYEKQVNRGDIKPAGKILEVVIDYDAGKTPLLSVKELNKKNGYVPTVIPSDYNYRVQLLNSYGIVVGQQHFSIPSTVRVEKFDANGTIRGNDVEQSNVSFAVTLAWKDDASEIRVVDVQGKLILSSDLSNVIIVNNKPAFESISGDEFIEKSKKKINFNFFANKVFAQGNSEKVDIVFIGDAYTDMGAFRSDANRYINAMTQYEPFSTRASQLNFHIVDNTDDLQCKNLASRKIYCDEGTVAQRLNSAGVPYDVVAVIINSSESRGAAGNMAFATSNTDDHVMTHEIGHVLGKLLDEYAYEGEATEGNLDNKVYYLNSTDLPANKSWSSPGDGNCYAGNPPASVWNGIVSENDYRRGCTFLNFYASSQTSIMHTINQESQFFNKVSLGVLNRRMDILIGLAPDNNLVYVPRDIYAINRNGASGKTEVHQMSASSNFQEFKLQTATALGPTNSKQWSYALGFYDNDNIPDIYAINRNGASGKTEVHILSGKSNFSEFALQVPTALGPSDSKQWEFVGGNFDGDSKTDIYAINRRGASGKTEVHVLSGAKDFKEFSLQTATGLGPTDSKQWSFYSAGSKGGGSNLSSRDSLFAVNRRGASGKTEAHILNARSNFSEFNFQGVLPLEPTDSANWVFAGGALDVNRDIFVDIYAINRSGASGKAEAHVMADADRFEKFYLQTPTALGPAGDNWSFANAQDFETSTPPKPTSTTAPTKAPTVTIKPTAAPTTQPTSGPKPTNPPLVTQKPTDKPDQPVPTFVCGGSPNSICNTPTPVNRPTLRPGEPTPTNVQPTQVITDVPSVTPPVNQNPDDCLDPRSTPERIRDWVGGFLLRINNYVKLIFGNPQNPPPPPQPCIIR